jgi:hypothetical protein
LDQQQQSCGIKQLHQDFAVSEIKSKRSDRVSWRVMYVAFWRFVCSNWIRQAAEIANIILQFFLRVQVQPQSGTVFDPPLFFL